MTFLAILAILSATSFFILDLLSIGVSLADGDYKAARLGASWIFLLFLMSFIVSFMVEITVVVVK